MILLQAPAANLGKSKNALRDAEQNPTGGGSFTYDSEDELKTMNGGAVTVF